MRENLIFATLNEVSIIFEKESFINVKKVHTFLFIRIPWFLMSIDIVKKFITKSLKIFLTYSYAEFLFQIM